MNNYPRIPILFNVFLNDGEECTLGKFAYETKLGRMSDMPNNHAALQRGLNVAEKCADKNLMKFSKGKCKVQHLRRNNIRHQYMLEATEMERSSKGMDLCVVV